MTCASEGPSTPLTLQGEHCKDTTGGNVSEKHPKGIRGCFTIGDFCLEQEENVNKTNESQRVFHGQ